MTPTALALLVIVWPGHDFSPQSMDAADCQRAIGAISMAKIASDKRYATDTGISAYCIPLLGTVADGIVAELLAPPQPSQKPQVARIVQPPQ